MDVKKELQYDSVLQSDAAAEAWLSVKNRTGLGPFIAGKWHLPATTTDSMRLTPSTMTESSLLLTETVNGQFAVKDSPSTETVDYECLSVLVTDPSNSGLQKLTTINYKNGDIIRAHGTPCSSSEQPSSLEISRDLVPSKVPTPKKPQRYAILNSLASDIEKNKETYAVLESVSTGRTFNRTLTNIVPRSIRQFRFVAQMIYAKSTVFPSCRCSETIISVPADASLCVFAEKLAPAIIAKCKVIVYLDGSRPIIEDSPTDNTTVNLALFYLVEKIASLNSHENLRVDLVYSREPFSHIFDVTDEDDYGNATEGNRKLITVSTHTDSFCALIFDNCDVDAALEGLISMLCVAAEQRLLCRIFIQDTVWQDIWSRLVWRLDGLRVGAPLDRTADLGPLTSKQTLQLRDTLRAIPSDTRHFFFTAAEGLLQSFHTIEEAEKKMETLADGVRVSIWTEDARLAFRVADMLEADVVWINEFDLCDASVPDRCDRGCLADTALLVENCATCHSERRAVRDGARVRTDEMMLHDRAAKEARKVTASWGATSFEHRSDVLRAASLDIDRFFPERNAHREIVFALLVHALADCCEYETCVNVQVPHCKGQATVKRLPRGLVAITCFEQQSDWRELLVFSVSMAIAYGNAVVVSVPTERPEAAAALDVDSFFKLLQAAGLPENVVKVVPFGTPFDISVGLFDYVLDSTAVQRFPSVTNENREDVCRGTLSSYCREDIRLLLTRPKTIWNTFVNK